MYSGISTGRECNDSLYLFQLDALRCGVSGSTEKIGRVVDGSPSELDPWTVYGRINEWVWHDDEGLLRNNCEVLPGGTIVATRDIVDEEAFISYGSDYPWFHVKIPLLREIPWTLRKILKTCNASHFDYDISDLEEIISGMSSETGYRQALGMGRSGLAYALAIYVDGKQPSSVGHFSEARSSYNSVLDSDISTLKNTPPEGQLLALLHSSLPLVTSGEGFLSWLFRVLMCETFFRRHVFRYADHPDMPVASWPAILCEMPVGKPRHVPRN